MVSSRAWGLGGILVIIAGVLVIAPDALHSMQKGFGLEAIYGLAVLFAAIVTVLVVGRGIVAEG